MIVQHECDFLPWTLQHIRTNYGLVIRKWEENLSAKKAR